MAVVGNLLWLLLGGLWLGISYVVAGLLLCCTIVGIPLGVQAFKLAGYAFWPFGRAVVEVPGHDRTIGCVGNALWLVMCGWWIALMQVAAGLALAMTIIGIPFGIVSFRMAVLALWPFGKSVVSQDRIPPGARVVVGPIGRRR